MSVRRVVTYVFLFFMIGSARAGTPGTLSFSSSSYDAKQNTGQQIIMVNRSGSSNGSVSVTCRTFHITASPVNDYLGFSRTLTWANGDSSPKHCDISILNSHPFFGTRTLSIQLLEPEGATLGAISKSSVSIDGDEPTSKVSLSSPDYLVEQKAGKVTISVARSGYDGVAASVSYATAHGTAYTGIDYSGTHGELTWIAGDNASKTVVIPISNAKTFNGERTFAFAIAGASGTTLGTSSAIITIAGDAPTTGEATLTWTKPTTDTNGEPIKNLAGYKIYYGTSAAEFSHAVQVDSPTTLEYEIGSLAKGTWYFAVAAYDSANVESKLSATVTKTL